MDVTSRRRFIVFNGLLSLLDIGLSVVIVALDITLVVKLNYSASFAYKQLFIGNVDLNAIMDVITIFGILYVVAVMLKVSFLIPFFNESKDHEIYMIIIMCTQGLGLLLLETIRHPLYLKLITCMNNYWQDIIRARAALSIALMVVTLLFTILFIVFNRYSTQRVSQRIIKYISYFISIIVPLAVIGLNIAVLSILVPGNNQSVDIKNIKVGLFDMNEVVTIQNGSYTKDDYYSSRIITNVDNIVNSQVKRYAYTYCTYSSYYSSYSYYGYNSYRPSRSCNYYYYRISYVTINCNNQTAMFFDDDCTNATYLTFKFQYLDDKQSYPTYACARQTTDGKCVPCPILSDHSMVLIQENDNKLQLAWKGFSNCTNQPTFSLINDQSLNPCLSSSLQLKFDYICLTVLLLLTIIIFKF